MSSSQIERLMYLIYYTGLANQTRQTAGAKAPSDILALCEKRGYKFIPLPLANESLPKPVLHTWKYVHAVQFWRSILKKLQKGDALIFQYPLYASRALSPYIDKIQQKGIRLIVLIHDLETLRKGIEGAIQVNESVVDRLENVLLPKFDAIICHNDRMKQYLVSVGYQAEKLFCLEIFDYLSDAQTSFHSKKNETPSIAVAGNLLKTKSGYIYHIHDNGENAGLSVNLFGLSFDETCKNKNMIYHGSFPAAELPEKLEGDFGLVWDGPSAETCGGNTGEYLKYNNPHKTSLYLSSGLPVIVWSESAIAEFVKKHQVGLCLDSLFDLEDTIRAVTAEEYAQMRENARVIAKQLHFGYYFYSALDRAFLQMKDITTK